MSLIPSGLSVQEAYRRYRNGQIVVNRKYQRKLVWTQNEKRMLIDSILHEYPILYVQWLISVQIVRVIYILV